jgi:transposase InsO family protein
MKNSLQLLKNTIANVPFKIHTVLTDNGIQFTNGLSTNGALQRSYRMHPFDSVCERYGVQHRLTLVKHLWTNGLVECMNRSIKDQTVKIYFYESLDDLKCHPAM